MTWVQPHMTNQNTDPDNCKNSTLNNFKNSAIATTIAELFTLPICTTKTVYQNNNLLTIRATVKLIYNNGGIMAFYSASLPSVGGQVFSTASKYSLYNALNTHCTDNKFICGSLSGILVSTITHVFDVIKVHIQMQDNLTCKISENPYKLLVSGYKWTFAKAGIAGPIFFPLNEFLKETTNNVLISAVTTSIVTSTLMHPLDYFKTRSIYGNEIDIGKPFKGLSLNLMRTVPHFVIVMSIIDLLGGTHMMI